MKNKTWIIVAILAVAFGGLFIWAFLQKQAETPDYNNYDINAIIPANEFNGEIADHVKGKADAPVLLFEYADFQCSACALANKRLQKLTAEYGDKLAIVYRNFLLSYHQNGTAAASAAEAAGLQGYYNEYSNLLFTNQTAWDASSPSERTEIFKSYFETASAGQGNLEQFVTDLSSPRIKKKLDFDQGISTKIIDASATPTFVLAGEKLDISKVNGEDGFLNYMREKIDAALAAKGAK